MLIGCREGATAFLIQTEEYFLTLTDERLRIEYRIDDQPPVSARWNVTSDNKGLGLWRNSGIAFVRGLVGTTRLYIRIYERNGQSHSYEFDLTGIDEVAAEVASVCGWDLRTLSEADYRKIQTGLRAAGFYSGPIDGDFGLGSRKALKAWQEVQGMKADGVIGAAVVERLLKD